MPRGMSARWCATGFVSTTDKSNAKAAACASWCVICRARAHGSIRSSPNGCTASAPSTSPPGCCRPLSWPTGSANISTLLTSRIWWLQKRLPDSALVWAIFEAKSSERLVERLIQIGNQVGGVFHSQRQPHQVVLDAHRQPLISGQLVIRHQRRLFHQRLHTAQRG